jgi:NAD(P)-dependent dehydrogenase (short-subunit alcohol dehydrogenase family)
MGMLDGKVGVITGATSGVGARTASRLDLFNNAGGRAPTGGITSVPVEGFDRAMALLVRSVMLGMKHAARS